MAGSALESAEASYRNAVCSAVAVQRYRDNLAAGMRTAVENYSRFTRDPLAIRKFQANLEASLDKAVREFEAFACSPQAVEEAGRMFSAGYRGAFVGPELTASRRREIRGVREEDEY